MKTSIQRAVVPFVMLLALTVQVAAQDLPVLGQGYIKALAVGEQSADLPVPRRIDRLIELGVTEQD